MTFIQFFIFFIIYSFVGYIVEVFFVSFLQKKIVNRGFLCGPIIPIYGLGAITMIFLLKRYMHDYIALFIFGALIASTLEYFVGYALEKIFHNKWWDYSEDKFNLNGRVCMLNAILFGLGSVALIEYIHPIVSKYVLRLNSGISIILFIVLAVILTLDTIYSCIVAYNLRSRLIIVEELKKDKLSKLPNIFKTNIKKKVKSFKLYPSRLIKAFPNIVSKYKEEFNIMGKVRKNKSKK